jgi:TusA-related sulfurtransferase
LSARLWCVDDHIAIDEELSVRGLGCANVLIELARLTRERTRPWAVLVDTDDGGAPQELPSWCRMTGNTFVGLHSADGLSSRYLIVLEPKEST